MHAIPVHFDTRQVAYPDSYSPSAAKPALVVSAWKADGFPVAIEPVHPVTRAQLALAHEASFVEDVLDLRRSDGFGNRRADVAASFQWTSGSLLCAARTALANGQIAVSPTSGFHHAGYAHCAGYCTFNGLMVTAQVLLAEGKVGKVGVLDCDQHFGDGTEDIINHLELRAQIIHITKGLGYTGDAASFLAQLPDLVAACAGCDLLLYQAGADPHVDDPLGGYLTSEELLTRDRIVFQATARMGIPVVWNLAGGYQEPIERVLEIHTNTMRACLEAYFDPSEARDNAA